MWLRQHRRRLHQLVDEDDLEARRVVRLIACFAERRTLRGTVALLERFASDGTGRFLRSSLHGQLSARLRWAADVVVPRIDAFLAAERTAVVDDVSEALARPRAPGKPAARDEVRRLSALVAHARPPAPVRRESLSCPAGHVSRREAYRALAPLVEALGAGGARSQFEVFELSGAVVPSVKSALAFAMCHLGSSARDVLEVVASAEAIAAKLVATSPPRVLSEVEEVLRDEREAWTCAHKASRRLGPTLVDALRVHSALGSGEALMAFLCDESSLEPTPRLLCKACAEAHAAASRCARETALPAHRNEWAAIERQGSASLLRLRDRVRHASRVAMAAAEMRADEMAMRAVSTGRDFDDQAISAAPAAKLGRKPRRRATQDGSVVHATLEIAADSASDDAAHGALSRSVFVENLPCDATGDDVRNAFSRSGSVENVFLYSRSPRPTSPAAKGTRAPYRVRRATPDLSATSAFVEFSDSTGAAAATKPSLCIFGVLIGDRLCRTRKAADVKSFYLHRLAPHLSETRLADELGKALGDAAKPARVWRRDPDVHPDRARLRFHRHAAAAWAWRRLDAHAHQTPGLFELSWTATPPAGTAGASRYDDDDDHHHHDDDDHIEQPDDNDVVVTPRKQKQHRTKKKKKKKTNRPDDRASPFLE